MSRQQKHIDLTEADQNMLLKESKYHLKPEYREKCRAILLNHAGVSIKQIATHLQVSHITVGNWLRAWEVNGFSSLSRKVGQGRKPILMVTNALHTQVLDKAVEAHRQNVKAIQAELIQSLAVPMSADTVKRFLKKIIIHGDASGGVRTQAKTK
jgi:transposase